MRHGNYAHVIAGQKWQSQPEKHTNVLLCNATAGTALAMTAAAEEYIYRPALSYIY